MCGIDKYFSVMPPTIIISDILSSFNPDVDLSDCPVLATKSPTIVSEDQSGGNPAYVTSDNNAAPVTSSQLSALILTLILSLL